jgi:hypothetical protein
MADAFFAALAQRFPGAEIIDVRFTAQRSFRMGAGDLDAMLARAVKEGREVARGDTKEGD